MHCGMIGVTPKDAIGNSPFFLVYGREAILPPHVLLPSLQLSQKVQEEECPPLQSRINALIKLDEVGTQAKRKLDTTSTTDQKLV
jgi:hypothetical protein